MVALLQHIHASSWCIQNHYSDGLERTEQAIPPHSSSVSIAVTPNHLRVFSHRPPSSATLVFLLYIYFNLTSLDFHTLFSIILQVFQT